MIQANKTGKLRPSIFKSLSARLLVLTIFFVMLSEVLIYAPSIGRYRKVFLEETITKAHLATLALEAMPDHHFHAGLEKELLFLSGTYGIILERPRRRTVVFGGAIPPAVDVTYDLRKGTFLLWMLDAFRTLAQRENRVLRVIGVYPGDPSSVVEVIMDEAPMREAMFDYSARILNLSIVISLITAGLVFLSLQWLIVRPMGRITRNMAAFRENPEDASRMAPPLDRPDEIGIAQRELAVMQDELRSALRQKTRLATLGAAVAKINHDLRNSLSTAVLASDRLANIDDPEVKRVMPRLYHAMDRAINLCSHTLDYVSDEFPKLRPTLFNLHKLVAEVGSEIGSPGFSGSDFTWRSKVDFELDLEADREQLYRVLNNLGRNSRQAGAETVSVSARRDDERIVIDFSDDGPGISDRAKERIFKPFSGSAPGGGSGLGLIIAQDIMRAHGGRITLSETGPNGTVFSLEFPIYGP